MSERVYLDWNATAPLRPEARAAMVAAFDVAGNPSSVHAEGRASRGIVEAARADLAEALGCKPAEIVFTSGATEAAGVLSGFDRVWVEPTAHDALWSHANADSGPVDIRAMGIANSETGVVTSPPPEIGTGHLLLDVTQAVGRVPWSFAWSGADLAVLSAHKLGGPKGVGALIVRDGLDIPPLQAGGGQEMGRRSGTENVVAIAGFAAAIRAAMAELEAGTWDRVAELRNILENALASSENKTIFVGQERGRLPNTSCIATPGWKGETQVMAMDLAGFAISSGSACSSGKVRTSRVLAAMGYDATTAQSAVRVSLGPITTQDDVLRFAAAWGLARNKWRARAGAAAA
ncbi:MAG: aminotransferase class V-fold PLP-dependent enzyme [Pseudomonadota bacterium]